VDWSDLERRKEALRYIVKQIWNEALAAAPSLHKEGDERSSQPSGEVEAHASAVERISGLTERDVAEAYQSAPNWHSVLSSLECRSVKAARAALHKEGAGGAPHVHGEYVSYEDGRIFCECGFPMNRAASPAGRASV
jgi:hypothetical protein